MKKYVISCQLIIAKCKPTLAFPNPINPVCRKGQRSVTASKNTVQLNSNTLLPTKQLLANNPDSVLIPNCEGLLLQEKDRSEWTPLFIAKTIGQTEIKSACSPSPI